MDLGSPGHVHPDKESSTESQVYNLSRYRAYPLGQRMDAKEIRTSSLPPASYVESLPGGQVSSVNQPARSPRSMDYSNGQDEPPNMYHQSPSHRQDMICGCQICLATEPKISESPVKEFASPLDDPYFRSPLQSESIRERNPLRSNEAGGALLPENADWETVNQDDIGPSDSASRPQTPSTAHKGSQSIQIDCEEIERDQRYSEESWETEGYYHVRPSDSASRPNDPYRATFPPISPHEKSYRVENDSDGGLETHHGPFRSGIRRPDTESHIAQTGTEQDPGVEPSRALLYCVAGNCRYRTDRKIDLRRHYKVKHRHNERTLSLCAKRKGQ